MLVESNGRRASSPERSPRSDDCAGAEPPAGRRISAVVCAYNEAERIQHILEAVRDHPALLEVIVVNDGSTDDTDRLLKNNRCIRYLSHSPNRGKTYALCRGIAAARGDYLMLLDADLTGVQPSDIQALADPVLHGQADVSISLRSNSLALYQALGLDFVSGERVLPAWLLAEAVPEMEALPRWGGEAFINDMIVREQLSIAVVRWRGVFNIRKYKKLGPWRGFLAELTMIGDAFRVLTPWGTVRQNLALLRLVRRPKRRLAPRLFGRNIADQAVR